MRKAVRRIALLMLIILTGCSDKSTVTSHQHGQPMNHNMDDAIVMLNEHERLLANVTVDSVRWGSIEKTAMLLGTTNVNQKKITVISARVRGRLDRLFVRDPGERIRRGQPLYSIYSEELLADQNEYLLTLRQKQEFATQQKTTEALVEAARKKLLLWGFTERQLSDLALEGRASPLVTFYSPVDGILVDLLVYEGQYVAIGSSLYTISDLSSLWVEAQVYPGEVNSVIEHPDVEVELEAYPDSRLKGRLAFDNPAFKEGSTINYVRYEIANPKFEIKTGMMTYVYLTEARKQGRIVPRSAIVYESMPAVWVQVEEGVFEKRMVTLGLQNKTEVEVLEGLKEGEVVAVTGGYLINSQYTLLKGAGSMAGMKM